MPMTYSYTQISQYLRCPRSYRYRYLDGWREKETRAAMAFGRSFENALGAFFRGEDPGAYYGAVAGRVSGTVLCERHGGSGRDRQAIKGSRRKISPRSKIRLTV